MFESYIKSILILSLINVLINSCIPAPSLMYTRRKNIVDTSCKSILIHGEVSNDEWKKVDPPLWMIPSVAWDGDHLPLLFSWTEETVLGLFKAAFFFDIISKIYNTKAHEIKVIISNIQNNENTATYHKQNNKIISGLNAYILKEFQSCH